MSKVPGDVLWKRVHDERYGGYAAKVKAKHESKESPAKEKKEHMAKKMKSWRMDLIKLNKGDVHAKDLKGEARRLIKEKY